MKKWICILTPALVLLSSMLFLLLSGERDAAAARREVVRFHVVAASNEAEEQRLKLLVRDGLFARLEELFADCTDRRAALETAEAHRAELETEAEAILRENGSLQPVTLEIGERYFPTKDYGSLSFPAGRYQAVSIRIGEAKGQNFWCVLFPALCIAPAVAEDTAEDEMAAVVGEETTQFLKRSSQKQKIKFALVEILESVLQKYRKR